MLQTDNTLTYPYTLSSTYPVNVDIYGDYTINKKENGYIIRHDDKEYVFEKITDLLSFIKDTEVGINDSKA